MCILYISYFSRLYSFKLSVKNTGGGTAQNLKCNRKHTGKEHFGQYMKDLDAISICISIVIIIITTATTSTTTTTTVIIILIIIISIIIIFSGNSSECRLEVSAATLADHGTWTCSLSQDKVSMMLLMIMLQCQRQGEDAGQIGRVVQTVLTNSKVRLGGLD